MDTQELARQFNITHILNITDHHPSWPIILVNNHYATAEIHLYGAHMTHYQPHGARPVLWLSDQALYQTGKAIRGGIPIIWPWFGPHPTDSSKEQHGLARTSWWQISKTDQNAAGETEITLFLEDNDTTRAIWPHPFYLELFVTVGQQLRIALAAQNKSAHTVPLTAALHSYFNVGDINHVRVEGLENASYLDKAQHNRLGQDSGPLAITDEVDRVYINTAADCVIKDAAFKRAIRISKGGSQSTVVWNPWINKSQNMSDFPDEGYQRMLCLETANASEHDTVQLNPGGIHTLTAVISVEPLTA